MADIEQLTAGIEAVARFHEKRFGQRSPFHLSACGGCGCPAFQQPCSLCRYYPMGTDRGTWHPKVATKELFCSMVEKTGPGGSDGTIATWHALGHLQKYEDRAALIDAASQIDVPSAAEYWDAVCVEGLSLSRPPEPRAMPGVWYGVSDMAAIANGQMFAKPSRQAPAVNALVREWVDALHSGDDDEFEDALTRIRKMASDLQYEYPRNGNLTSAVRAFDSAIDTLRERVPSMGAR